MPRRLNVLVWVGLVLLLRTAAVQASPTLIDSQPDGKRVLQVYDKEIASDATKKNLLYIDGNDILANIHDPAVLVIDDNDVRPSAAGVILARFDSEDLRHGARGKVVINYHHPDICPDAHSNRIYRVDGPKLTRQQLVAVLYILKPEIFQLSPDEKAAQQKERADNAAEADSLAAADQAAGKWDVLNGNGPVANIGKGAITFGPKKGDVYPAIFDYAAGGGPSWAGVAAYKVVSGDRYLWTAYGTPKTIGLCVYEIDGGTLTGKWYPWYCDGDPKNVGTETLSGPASLDGEFKIVSAKTPTTGAPYAGTVSIAPTKIVGADESEQPYLLTWTLGTVKIRGIGIRSGKNLFVASGSGADVLIAMFKIENGSFHGDFFKLGSTEMGSTAATH